MFDELAINFNSELANIIDYFIAPIKFKNANNFFIKAHF